MAELVSSVVYWVDPGWFVPFLGVLEIAVGLGLLAQMIGTFLVLIIRPDIALQNGHPLLLTIGKMAPKCLP